MNKKEIWQLSQTYIRSDINSNVVYNTYLKDACAVSFENNIFTIAVTLPTRKSIIDIKYKKIIENALTRITGKSVILSVIISTQEEIKALLEKEDNEENKDINDSAQSQNNSSVISSSNLNSKYTMDNFVVGKSNSYAFAAAENVIKFPGQNNNPLFIYGNSGLGKTHLMQAIGNEILKRNPEMVVRYVTSEQFTNEMIASIQKNTMMDFKHRYRDVDLLLVDDIQFIEGKDGTQEEFFHTFNDLHSNNKQIVLTSDRKPKDLITLAERLRTRFEWGLSIDIVTPDYETRVAILRKKAESLNITLDNELYEYIAEIVKSNVRELEGALSQIIAYAAISKKDITIELAEEALSSIIPNEIRITPQTIIEKVCDFYHLQPEDIKGPSKVKELVNPRHVAMYLCKTMTTMTFVDVAKIFGRDRTTVMHGVDRIMKNITVDSSLKDEINFIVKNINS